MSPKPYLTLLLLSLCAGGAAQAPVFALHEIDLHLHSGMERQVPLDEWVDLAVADGRKVVVLVDDGKQSKPEEASKVFVVNGDDGTWSLHADGKVRVTGRK
ncbi:MAG: hypothetical protein NTY38_11330 [Acidobacteria bacterium]|nr:hypothetical protein [Acidobacteriota bacterium]